MLNGAHFPFVMLNEVKHPLSGFLATLGMREKSAWNDKKDVQSETEKPTHLIYQHHIVLLCKVLMLR